MASYTVTVTVDNAAISALPATPEAQRLLDRCAERALDFQKATVPVDTGALKACLGIESVDNELGRKIGAIVNPVEYAIYVEEGHRTPSGTWVAAQPFIRPSIDAAKKGLSNG